MQEPNESRGGTTRAKPRFSDKDRVDHSRFGLGTIVTADEHYTTIAFDESGTRKFVTSMVKLTASDVPAPARRVRRKKKTASSR